MLKEVLVGRMQVMSKGGVERLDEGCGK
jgi:hypothetical protein